MAVLLSRGRRVRVVLVSKHPRAKRNRNRIHLSRRAISDDAAACAAERFARGPFDKLRVTLRWGTLTDTCITTCTGKSCAGTR
jgi:hypothetical protein